MVPPLPLKRVSLDKADSSAVIHMGDAMILATVVSADKRRRWLPTAYCRLQRKICCCWAFSRWLLCEARPTRKFNHAISGSRFATAFPKRLSRRNASHATTDVAWWKYNARRLSWIGCIDGNSALWYSIWISDFGSRVARIDGDFVVNPSREQLQKSTLILWWVRVQTLSPWLNDLMRFQECIRYSLWTWSHQKTNRSTSSISEA